MSDHTAECRNCERLVAGLLRHGTWLASVIIAAGLAVERLHRAATPMLHGSNGLYAVKAGIALFIFLPVARLVLMLAFFLRERDYVYTAISAFVLAIIGTGLVARL